MTKRKKIIVICAFLLISFIIPNKVKAKESASVKYQTPLPRQLILEQASK